MASAATVASAYSEDTLGMDDLSVEDVGAWLGYLGQTTHDDMKYYGGVIASFREHQVDGSALAQMAQPEMEKLGVDAAHVQGLLEAVANPVSEDLIVVKNHLIRQTFFRGLSTGEYSVTGRGLKLQNDEPPSDAIFWQLWGAGEEEADAALGSVFIQGIKSGQLDPNSYGGFSVSDAFYCYKGADSYGVAAMNALLHEGELALGLFLLHKQESYNSYNKTFKSLWRIRDGAVSVWPTVPILQYAMDERQVAEKEHPIYTIVAMLPCEYLWYWLAEQLLPFRADNVYKGWIDGNYSPLGPTGAYTMGNVIQSFADENPSLFDMEKATYIYKRSMASEVANFNIVPGVSAVGHA